MRLLLMGETAPSLSESSRQLLAASATLLLATVTLPYAARGVIEFLKGTNEMKSKRVFMGAFAAWQREIVAEVEKRQDIQYEVQRPINGYKITEEAR